MNLRSVSRVNVDRYAMSAGSDNRVANYKGERQYCLLIAIVILTPWIIDIRKGEVSLQEFSDSDFGV